MCKILLYFVTLYICYHSVASASTFSFHNISSTKQVYEGEVLEVCVEGKDVCESTEVEIDVTFTSNMTSAIAGSDFTPLNLSLTFSRSSTHQTKCGYFSITQDGQDEEVEYFYLTLNHEHSDGKAILVAIHACRENDICLLQTPWSEGGFSTVEYCHQNHWFALCDYDWTAQDAKVTCRQAGYSEQENATNKTVNQAVQNSLMKVFNCTRNDTELVQCMQDPMDEQNCYPVLVKCGPTSSSTSGSPNIAVGVTVPVVLILVAGGSTSIALVIIFLVVQKRKYKQKQDDNDSSKRQDDEPPPSVRNIPNPFIDELTSQLCGSSEHRGSRYIKQNDIKGSDASESKSTKSKQTSAPKDAVIENSSPTEYSAPFSPKAKEIPIPHTSTAGSGIPVQHVIQSRDLTQSEVEHHEYEGVGFIPMPAAAMPGPSVTSDMRQTSSSNGGQQVWSTTHPAITAQYSQLEIEQEEYSHLKHT